MKIIDKLSVYIHEAQSSEPVKRINGDVFDVVGTEIADNRTRVNVNAVAMRSSILQLDEVCVGCKSRAWNECDKVG